MRATRCLRPAVVLGVLLSVTPALAYVRSRTTTGVPVIWKDQCISIVVHNAPASIPAPLTAELVLKATNNAGAAWGRPGFTCTPLQITTTASADPYAPATNDGVNRVMFRQDKWCRQPAVPGKPCYDKGILAITTLTTRADGTIVDADIEINAVDFKWDDLSVKGRSGQDLQTVLTHEFGHLIGLDHNCYAGPANTWPLDHTGKPAASCADATTVTRAAVMYPAPVTVAPIRRTMSTDEALAICQVYATKAGTAACGLDKTDGGARDGGAGDTGSPAGPGAEPPGGCTIGGTRAGHDPGVFGLALAAGLAWLLRRRRPGR